MTGKLALFSNDKAGNDKRPDCHGVGEIDGVKVKASGWWNTSKKDGSKYLSVNIELDTRPEQSAPAGERPTPANPTYAPGPLAHHPDAGKPMEDLPF